MYVHFCGKPLMKLNVIIVPSQFVLLFVKKIIFIKAICVHTMGAVTYMAYFQGVPYQNFIRFHVFLHKELLKTENKCNYNRRK